MKRKWRLTKKKIVSLSIIAILLSIAAVGTLAYFTDKGTAHNVITTGKIDIVLNDQTIGDSGALVNFPSTGITGVMPGETVDKIVSITNNSTDEAWVRIRLDMSIVDDKKQPLEMTLLNDIPVLVLNYEEETKWFEGTDGNWYYSAALKPGETTDVLFDGVTFAKQMPNTYQNCTANIFVTAEAVQTAHNPVPENGTVEQVKGWPAEEA